SPSPTSTSAKPAPVRDITAARSKRKLWIAAGAAAALAAGVVGVAMVKSGGTSSQTMVASDGPIGTVKTISRAATEQGDGLAIKTDTGWRPLRADEMLPAGAEIRTDERTRASLELGDGTRLVLDHRTSVVFDPAEARRMKLLAGRLAADVAHVDKRQASITT